MIYLDSASTIKPRREVINTMKSYFDVYWHNPSSLYSPAVRVKSDIEKARKTVGKFINAKANEIYFTSGGSESNCWAIQGFVNRCLLKGKEPIVITSTIEHKSIMDCVEYSNAQFHFVGVDKDGFVTREALENILMKIIKDVEKTCCDYDILVSIQYANNEIGTIQNIKEITTIVHEYGGIFHTDAVQIVGQIPIDVKELGIDMLSASGHKFGTPKGIGFLYKQDIVKIQPLIYGSQMDGYRGGTENVPYIIGTAKAVELLNINDNMNVANMSGYMIEKLVDKFGCKLNGAAFDRLPNNVSVTFPQSITGEALLYTLDLSNIYVSTGSACNSKSIEPSYVLKAIGLTDNEAIRTVRFTLSEDTRYEDIDYVIEEIGKSLKLINL